MRRSEFDRAVADEFGGGAAFVLADVGLSAFGGRTSVRALADGEPPREVWLALCVEMDVPASRRYGVGRLEPGRR